MKILLDCPLCNVYMKQRARSGTGERSFVCPRCGSKFIVNRADTDDLKAYINKMISKKSIAGEPSLI